MPKQADEINQTLKAILSTLQAGTNSAKSKREESGHQERMTGLIQSISTRASQGAGGFLAGAVAATGPNITGTLLANTQSLFGEIGKDEAVIRQVVRLSGALADLKDKWRGLSQETRTYVVNSAVATLAVGGLAAGVSRLSPMLSGLGGRSIGGGATLGDLGDVAGHLSKTGLGRIGVGAGIAGLGMGINAAVGRNLVGDSLFAGGVAHAAYGAGMNVSNIGGDLHSRGFQRTGRAFDAVGSLIGPVGTAAAIATMATPSAGQAVSSSSSVNRIEAALSQHENNFTMFQDESARRRSLRGLGYSDEQTNAALTRAGVGHGWSMGGLFGGGFGSTALGQGQLSSVSRELAYPGSTVEGSVAQKQSHRSDILASLNFQSRQFGIGDLHDVIQQQAVMDPAQKDERRRLLETLENLEREISAMNAVRNAPPDGANVAGGGNQPIGQVPERNRPGIPFF